MSVLLLPVFLVYFGRLGILSYRQSAFVFVAFLLLIFGLAYSLDLNVVTYVSKGMTFIGGYQEAMYQPRTEITELIDIAIGIICFGLLILPFFLFFKKIIASKETCFLFIVVVPMAFLLFKGLLSEYRSPNFLIL